MNNRINLLLGLAVVVAVGLFLLSPDRTPVPGPLPPTADPLQLPEGHPPLPQSAASAGVVSGPTTPVLETMASGGYTYARVAVDGTEVWVAGPVTALAVGDDISLAGAMGMQNFHAASLDRTFETILFVNAFATPAANAAADAVAGTAAGATWTSGTVLEVAQAPGYVYLRVEVDGDERWIAGEALEIAEGDVASWTTGSVMQNFVSSTLGRTFDEILFVEALRVGG